jgi:hypothetical protein
LGTLIRLRSQIVPGVVRVGQLLKVLRNGQQLQPDRLIRDRRRKPATILGHGFYLVIA